MSFRLTPAAEDDLGEILAYVAEHASPERAHGVLAEVFRAAELLSDSPLIGHRRADLTAADVLFWPVVGLLLAYLPAPPPIVVVRVLHASRDPNVLSVLLREGD